MHHDGAHALRIVSSDVEVMLQKDGSLTSAMLLVGGGAKSEVGRRSSSSGRYTERRIRVAQCSVAHQPQFLPPLHQAVGQLPPPQLGSTDCISSYTHTTVPSSLQRVVIAGSLDDEYELVQVQSLESSVMEIVDTFYDDD